MMMMSLLSLLPQLLLLLLLLLLPQVLFIHPVIRGVVSEADLDVMDYLEEVGLGGVHGCSLRVGTAGAACSLRCQQQLCYFFPRLTVDILVMMDAIRWMQSSGKDFLDGQPRLYCHDCTAVTVLP
jgi:hypothetical protein